MKCGFEMGGIICIPGFMKIGTGVEGILRFGHSNLKGCYVGITEPIVMELSMCIIPPDPISMMNFINPFHQALK
jgi:hypothetical protein